MTQYPELINALLDKRAYPEYPLSIKLMQTQMSFVLLTGEFVYKIKKPVNLGYLDYTTLDNRKHFCQKEVDLNRRLCSDVYLGVVPITEQDGKITIGGRGEVIEYAVKMRCLPQERMLNVLLESNKVTSAMIEKVAQKVALFHAKAETNTYIGTFGNLQAIKVNTDENFRQTEKYIGITLSAKSFEAIKVYTNTFIESGYAIFNERVDGGKIKDCHGDLHAAHICFADEICIYDCIEFNDRFRYCDTASEIAFLAMDLDRYNRKDLSDNFVLSYIKSSNDVGIQKILPFYKCYRAYVRGKVESFKYDDPYIDKIEKDKTGIAARKYFDLAESYIQY
jgi:uncharacterized protein